MAVFGIELAEIITALVRCAISIIVGLILYRVIRGLIIKLLRGSRTNSKYKKKRLQTLQSMLINFTKYILYIVVGLYILSVFGVNVNGIVAGLGVSAALIGLAFQDTAKDIIAGLSLIADDEFEIGDTVKIGDFMGEVIFIGLKSTKVRNFKGETLIVSNRSIDKVINYNLHNSLAIVDISVAYESDLEKVENTLEKLARRLNKKLDYLKGEVLVLGIDNLDDDAIIYRVTAEVEAMRHFEVQRTLRKEIVKAFRKDGIKIPYNQIEVHNAK